MSQNSEVYNGKQYFKIDGLNKRLQYVQLEGRVRSCGLIRKGVVTNKITFAFFFGRPTEALKITDTGRDGDRILILRLGVTERTGEWLMHTLLCENGRFDWG